MPGANTPYTTLDANQVLKQSFDETNDLLRVGIVGATLAPIDVGGMAVQIAHTEDSVRLGNGTNYIGSTTVGLKVGMDVNIINDTLPLPTGAATSAKQTTSVTSTLNSSTATLNAGATFTGTGEDTNGYNTVTVAVKTDQSGTLYIEFSPDNSNWDSSLSFSLTASVNEVHRLTCTRRYFRIRFTNTAGSNQTYFRAQSMLGNHPMLTSALNSTIQNDSDTILTRSILYGEDDSGSFRSVPITSEGHLEVAIHSPLLPFGALHTENLDPLIQVDAVTGLNTLKIAATSGLSYEATAPTPGVSSGTNTGTNNLFTSSTGTTQYSFATMQSVQRARYKAGQGIVARYTALWSAPAANSIVVAGVGTAESGFFFGYNGTSFGILHSTGNIREIQTLTISAAATTGGTIIMRLNGLDYTVTIPTSSTTTRTAYDISKQNFPGWSTEQIGSTVIFLADSVGNKSGTFSLTRGTALVVAGTFAETLAGATTADTWIAQTDWNTDKMDGTGSSGITLDKTKGNVFQIGIQYLGFGAITFQIEAGTSPNNPTWITVHVIHAQNNRTSVTQNQPTFPFTMVAYSAGSTTNVSVSVGSFAIFIEGQKHLNGPRMTYTREANAYVGSTSSTYYPLMTVRNQLAYAGKANQSLVNLISIIAAHTDNTIATIYLIKNATLIGPVNFAQWSTNSCTCVDQGATTCTFSSNEQIVFTMPIANASGDNLIFSDEIVLQPGETITIAARTTSGTTPYLAASLNTREDQ